MGKIHKGRISKPRLKNMICSLCCDKTKKEKVDVYVGGFCGFAHKSCMDIAQKSIQLWENYIVFHYKILPEIQKKLKVKKNKCVNCMGKDKVTSKYEGERCEVCDRILDNK